LESEPGNPEAEPAGAGEESKETGALALWKRIPLRDRVLYGVVLAIVLAGLAVHPVWRVLDPNFCAVAERSVDLEAHFKNPDNTRNELEAVAWNIILSAPDPWGQHFRNAPNAGGELAYSLGPNGVDEDMRGDDVLVTPWRIRAFGQLPDFLFGLAALLAVLWEGFRGATSTLRKPRGSLPKEIARAAALGVVPALVLFVAAWWLIGLIEQSAPGVVESARDSLLVPLPLALAGSAFGVSTLAFLYWRTREPSPGK
jgi:hypothetical protein